MTIKAIRRAATFTLSLWLLTLAADARSSSGLQTRAYAIDAAQSSFTIFVGKAGLFSGLGHDHLIAVKSFGGRVQLPAGAIEQASLEMEIEAGSLAVADKGISDKERAEIQKTMETDVLAVSRFPKIVFKSVSVKNVKQTGAGHSFTLDGDLTLRGVTRRVTMPIAVTVTPEQLRATGEATIKQTDFGVKPYSAGLGAVKVKNELKLSFNIVAKVA